MFVPVGTLYLVVAATGSLVTQELAFRRLLVGQAGDAGLAVVGGSAVAFAAWHLVIPTGGSMVQVGAGALINGVALGSLYALSRSLLVCAWYHGVQLAGLNALRYQASVAVGSEVGLGDGFWFTQLGLATLAAAGLAYFVWRRNGLLGAVGLLPMAEEPEADQLEEAADVVGD